MVESTPAESFWDFSVRTYRSDGVPEACLSLQDNHAVDVNMLLFCCWCGRRAGHFDDALFDAAIKFSESWYENVVAKLRDARRWMKHDGCHAELMAEEPCMSLREKIKQVEFAAEKIQEEALASLVEGYAPGKDKAVDIIVAVAANLNRYFHHLDETTCNDVRVKLAVIVCAAFPDVEESAVTAVLQP